MSGRVRGTYKMGVLILYYGLGGEGLFGRGHLLEHGHLL